MFFILAAPGMYATPQTQETDKKALREQRREERRQKREERREERQQRKKSRKPRNPRFLYPQLILPRKLFTKKSRLLVSQSLFQSKKKRNRNLLRSKIKRILHLRKSYNHPNKPYLQLCSRLKLHILIQNQKRESNTMAFTHHWIICISNFTLAVFTPLRELRKILGDAGN